MFGYEEDLKDEISRLNKRINKLEQGADAQTIMFWHLQFQFLALQDWHKLDDIAQGIGERQLMFTTRDYEELATELALKLSGVES